MLFATQAEGVGVELAFAAALLMLKEFGLRLLIPFTIAAEAEVMETMTITMMATQMQQQMPTPIMTAFNPFLAAGSAAGKITVVG